MGRSSRRIRIAAASAVALLGWGLVGVVIASPAGAVAVNCGSGNLQSAINATPPGGTVNVSGTCVGNFFIDKDLKVVGPATLDGGGNGTVLTITPNRTVRLVDLTVQNGNGSGAGGILTSAILTIIDSRILSNHGRAFGDFSQANHANCSTNCTVTQSNQAVGSAGGGILNRGTLVVRGTLIQGNSAQAFGSVSQVNSAECTANCTLTQSNTSVGEAGGGILGLAGSVRVESSRIIDNSAKGSGDVTQSNSADCTTSCTITQTNVRSGNAGGGILNSGASLTVVDTTVNQNDADARGGLTQTNSATCNTSCAITQTNSHNGLDGGGILNDGTATMNGVTVSANTSDEFGGGITNLDALTAVDVQIVRNTANGLGGGVYNNDDLTLRRSSVRGNRASAGGGIFNSDTVTISDTEIANNTPDNCIGC